MKILLTGATGYLGSRLLQALLKEDNQVEIIKRTSSSIHRIKNQIKSIKHWDIDNNGLKEVFRQNRPVDTILHTATCYGRNGESEFEIFQANSLFPLQLLNEAVQAGVKNFVNTDTSIPKNFNAYALSKKQFTEWGKYFSYKYKIRFINLRLEHFYGPGDDYSKFISWLVYNCLREVDKLDLTAGDQERDFIYIDDVVSAYLSVIKNLNLLTKNYISIDIGAGKVVSIKSLVEEIHDLCQSKTRLCFGAKPYNQHEVMFSKADTIELNKLDWTPQVPLKEGLKKLIKFEKKRLL